MAKWKTVKTAYLPTGERMEWRAYDRVDTERYETNDAAKMLAARLSGGERRPVVTTVEVHGRSHGVIDTPERAVEAIVRLSGEWGRDIDPTTVTIVHHGLSQAYYDARNEPRSSDGGSSWLWPVLIVGGGVYAAFTSPLVLIALILLGGAALFLAALAAGQGR